MWTSPDGPVDVAIKTLKNEASDVEKVKFYRRQPSWASSIMLTLSHCMEWSLWQNQ